MKKYLTIVSGILLALLCASSCGKQGTDEEPIVGARGSFYCNNNETGIQWTLTFSSYDSFLMYGRTSKGVFNDYGFYSRHGYNNTNFDFNNTIITVPADISPSGQKEQYRFCIGKMNGQTIVIYYQLKIEDGDWSGRKTLTFK